ncbi:hypothetical protein HAV21_12565 [Paenarthrobacter sp. MSM-2-10-13]|uniref:hypothetical protein n=1 Tax=Micrococcaceae TaxID=1268 RepID=UPI00115D551C|nr:MULTISPECIES: hypothetical protein [Micrococcaceae]MCM0616992.1 hypothetical protein [Paenarthrobacter sp. TYUT067]NHW47717.1 hypothetical protein [Paenarthrobacter sp. MSM-2-10-13]TQS93597.1 hypothetical protein EU811_04905 [Arthrobacter sp. TS-15]
MTHLTLHAVRLLGFADTQSVAARFSQDPAVVEFQLIDAGVNGFVSHSTFAGVSGWSLSNLGRSENERLLAEELDRARARDAVMAVHADFADINTGVVEACSAVQLQTSPGEEAMDVLIGALASWRPLEAQLSGVLPRFEGYSQRLLRALKLAVQDTAWLTATDRDSFHRVWFELHEDLIATLGIQRG